jgi:AcrR family transcriptional regulator
MSTTEQDRRTTRERLLNAAGAVFAEKGYHEATIAEISDRAGANIASVNYHFGSKESLYAESWRESFHSSISRFPVDGGVSADAPADQRLRGFIVSAMQRIADPESHEFEIVHKELANPTGLLFEVMREAIGPLRAHVRGIVRELLGEAAPETQILLCMRSVRAQIFDLMIPERQRSKFGGDLRPSGHDAIDLTVDALADHATRFSLAGIAETRRRIESGEIGEEV